jgi:hypothetical protein
MVDKSPSPILKSAVRLLWPLFILPYFLVKYLYIGVLGWWLDPWLLARDRKRLWTDIIDEMPFLGSNGTLIKSKRLARSFDYASVHLDFENVRVCITRGRGEIAVSLSPHASLEDSYRLGVVFEALGLMQYVNQSSIPDLRAIDHALEAHWNTIRTEFSDNHYPKFKATLSEIKHDRQKTAREAQWELAKHLGRLRK